MTDEENQESVLCDCLRPGMSNQFDGHLLREGDVYLCRRDVVASNLNGYDSQWGGCAVSVDLFAPAAVLRHNALVGNPGCHSRLTTTEHDLHADHLRGSRSGQPSVRPRRLPGLDLRPVS